MRPIALIALALLAAGCSQVTYNCNAPGSCPAAPKPGLSLSFVRPAPQAAR